MSRRQDLRLPLFTFSPFGIKYLNMNKILDIVFVIGLLFLLFYALKDYIIS